MDERVQKYLSIRKKEKEAEKEAEKEKKLIGLGLFDKVYVSASEADDSTKSETVSGELKYYKEVAWNFSDDEYRELEEIEDKGGFKNVRLVLTIAAVLSYLLGFIAGIVLSRNDIIVLLVCWIAGFIGGSLYLGLAEIVNLLQTTRK